MIEIDKQAVREELDKRNMLGLQRELTRQRRLRTGVMATLLLALLTTVVFGTLEDPFLYTFSNIGNFFDYRLFFIVWSILAGLAIQVAILALFRLEDYLPGRKWKNVLLFLAVVLLVATALIPALKDVYPTWHVLHFATAILHAVCVCGAFVPFSLWVSRENPRLRRIILWMIAATWGGSLLALVFFGKSGLFEMWFYVGMIVFLLYLSLVLFEEKIVKMSVAFLRDEDNLNLAIEKYFVDLEKVSPEKKRPAESAKAAAGTSDSVVQ